ncbi:MAG: hypothetical protein HN348_20105 [Proteobacteria bacterium]|nr:hypothetical protein [Pseudomonadota bacterium]
MVQNFQFKNGDEGFQYITALNITHDEVDILEEWEETYELSRIPILAVGSEADFKSWDLNGYCPSFWILDRDFSVMKADEFTLDFDEIKGWL